MNPFRPTKKAEFWHTPVSLDYEINGALFEIYMNRPAYRNVLVFAVMNQSHSFALVVREPVLAIQIHNLFGVSLAYAGGLADMINANFAHRCPSCRAMVEGLNPDKLCKHCTEALERIQQHPKPKLPTIYEIKRANQKAGGHFFDRKTMRMFGDTLKSFRVYLDQDRILVERKPCRGSRQTRWQFHPSTGVMEPEENPAMLFGKESGESILTGMARHDCPKG